MQNPKRSRSKGVSARKSLKVFLENNSKNLISIWHTLQAYQNIKTLLGKARSIEAINLTAIPRTYAVYITRACCR